ncbi:catalase [Aphanomyces astaci]|uniref:Catalase n=1 Tax=Aphanomyces astaci TaxID=112090 RepID=W4GL93_APHAT|nr:catalase [Aphanomyces astaci]ETV80460.1 catalase [Aphanomyces astaci]|eukprot:XP_009830384.1 catalase [Aphanomyces astaci]
MAPHCQTMGSRHRKLRVRMDPSSSKTLPCSTTLPTLIANEFPSAWCTPRGLVRSGTLKRRTTFRR